jgi:predicted metal-dependent HD superfamily phosphohydrolase
MTRERFAELWDKHLLPTRPSDSDAVYDELWRRYAEDHRRYHTPAHIDFCLAQLDLAKHLMEDTDAVEMALWFHDLIYNPSAPDNELKSAQRFVELAMARLDPVFVENVRQLILATIPGRSPERPDEKLVVDIDLSSFAVPWWEFKRDSRFVREEFGYLPDRSFYAAQLKLHRSLLDRPTFYFTEFFRERLERAARKNIKRYTEALRAKGDA